MDEASNRVERELFARSLFPVRLSDSSIHAIANALKPTSFASGDVIYTENHAAEELYFVQQGEVELRSDGEHAWKFGPQSVIGVLDAVLERPYARTAVATQPIRGFVLGADEYFDLLEDNFDDSVKLMVGICKSLHEIAMPLSAPDQHGGEEVVGAGGEWRREPLHQVERLMALRAVKPLRQSPVQSLVRLSERVHQRSLLPGDVVYTEGQPATSCAFVTAGRFDLYRSGTPVGVSYGPATLLGDYVSFAYPEHYYTVRAREAGIVLIADMDDIFDAMEDHFGLMRCLFKHFTLERIRVQTRLAEEGHSLDNERSHTD